MDFWTSVLVVEYALLGAAGAYALIERARQRAAMRRLFLYAFRQHPIANTAPPTYTESVEPGEWNVPPC